MTYPHPDPKLRRYMVDVSSVLGRGLEVPELPKVRKAWRELKGPTQIARELEEYREERMVAVQARQRSAVERYPVADRRAKAMRLGLPVFTGQEGSRSPDYHLKVMSKETGQKSPRIGVGWLNPDGSIHVAVDFPHVMQNSVVLVYHLFPVERVDE